MKKIFTIPETGSINMNETDIIMVSGDPLVELTSNIDYISNGDINRDDANEYANEYKYWRGKNH